MSALFSRPAADWQSLRAPRALLRESHSLRPNRDFAQFSFVRRNKIGNFESFDVTGPLNEAWTAYSRLGRSVVLLGGSPMKFLTKACFGMLLAASAMSTPAFAQEEASGPVSLSGGISVTSDYRFRGISLSNEKVAVQPTLTVSHDSGFYVGVWGSSLPDSPLYGKFELDLYAGFATEIAPGTTVDLGATYYVYPGNQDFAGPSDYVEIIGKLSHDIGPVSATGMVAYAPDQNSLGSDDNIYLNLGLGYGIPDTPVTLNAALGYTDGSLGALAPGGNYLDWMLGASFAAGPATFTVQYIDTDIKKSGIKAVDTLFDPTVVFTLGFSF